MAIKGMAIRRTALLVGAAACLLVLGSRPSWGQDPAQVNAKTVHVKLENSRVRVLESTLEPGVKEQLHSHPACVIYVIAGGSVRNHGADGKATEATLVTGDTIYREPLVHWAENIGETTIHLILVELKDPPKGE